MCAFPSVPSEPATTADFMFLYQTKLPLDQMLNNGSHCFTFRAVIDINSRLAKPHERPHADPPNYESVRTALLQQIHWGLTSALLVRRIVHHRNITDFSVFDVYQSKNIAMPEVS
jgi:hypothetical protein